MSYIQDVFRFDILNNNKEKTIHTIHIGMGSRTPYECVLVVNL